MRPLVGLALVAALSTPALVAGAGTLEESVADRFGSVSFSGSDGSLDWSGPWVEQGESDGPAAGQITVADGECAGGKCLTMTGGLLSEVAVYRPADLSEFLDGKLTFYVHIDPALLSVGELYVQVRGNGSSWVTVADYSMLTDAGAHQGSVDVGPYLGSDFRLRFALTGVLGGDVVSIDDVKVAGSVTAPTTTSTTSTSSTTSTTVAADDSSSVSSTSSTTTTTTASATTTDSTEEEDDLTTGDDPLAGPVATSEDDDGDEDGGVADGDGSEPTSGIQVPAVGLMAHLRTAPLGDHEHQEVEVLGAELDADFSLAVEVFERARIWISLLALLITAAVISGVDRRRSPDRAS